MILLKNKQAAFWSGPGVLPVRIEPFAGGLELHKVHFSPTTLRPQRTTRRPRTYRMHTCMLRERWVGGLAKAEVVLFVRANRCINTLRTP